jgi:hypothetical protein
MRANQNQLRVIETIVANPLTDERARLFIYPLLNAIDNVHLQTTIEPVRAALGPYPL